ncbi:HDOD domain-containing protein [bacterium]|nr:HDOD domain-containing protein [bacterium]
MNPSKLKNLISQYVSGEQLHCTCHELNERDIKFIDILLLKILMHHDLQYFVDSLEMVVRELMTNAYKANLKRIYFEKKQLQLSSPDDYKEGLKQFKKEALIEPDQYNPELKKSNLYIELVIQKKDDAIHFAIINNSPAQKEELERINGRLKAAEHCHDFLESYNSSYDESEGAGLGIQMVYFLLRNSGIDPSAFKISSENGITRSEFEVPFHLRPRHVTSIIKDQILKEVELLPTLPANIVSLIELCKKPDKSIAVISEKIKRDPSLTVDVLKQANSVFFGSGNKIDNVNDAVVRIGISNLEALLLAAGAKKILSERYDDFSAIWNHCQKTACYTRYLVKKYHLERISDQACLASLLHDFGKIVLVSLSEDISNKIDEILANRDMPVSSLIEEISIGISHSEIGAMIASKWNFPDYLVEIIMHHHTPLNAKAELKDQTYVTYLSNMLCGIENEQYKHVHMEEDVLHRFNLEDEQAVFELLDECRRESCGESL